MKTDKMKITVSIFLIFFVIVGSGMVKAQTSEEQGNQKDAKNDSLKTYSEIEQTQDQIEDVTLRIYEYYENYPDFTYTYDYDDNGNLKSVEIAGVGNEEDMRALERDLTELENLRNEIKNQANRIKVYYVTETLPKPKDGYNNFYNELYSKITYPDDAIDNRIEGTVYVKFLVDEEGEVILTTANHTLDAANYNDHLVEEMVKEAETAVESTSGDWIPGKIADVPVTQWMMIPVEFETETHPSLRPLDPF